MEAQEVELTPGKGKASPGLPPGPRSKRRPCLCQAGDPATVVVAKKTTLCAWGFQLSCADASLLSPILYCTLQDYATQTARSSAGKP